MGLFAGGQALLEREAFVLFVALLCDRGQSQLVEGFSVEATFAETTLIPLRTLYNPDTCPVHLLPHLAWAWSVDRWDPEWPESVKRAAIKASFYIHKHKGTIGALRRVSPNAEGN